MPDDPENITLVYLRRLDGKMDRMGEDVRELKLRMTALETAVGNLAATELSHYAILADRTDRLSERMERIERRLELQEAG